MDSTSGEAERKRTVSSWGLLERCTLHEAVASAAVFRDIRRIVIEDISRTRRAVLLDVAAKF